MSYSIMDNGAGTYSVLRDGRLPAVSVHASLEAAEAEAAQQRTANLSPQARAVIGLLLAPSDEIEHDRVMAEPEVWEEIREAFPVPTDPALDAVESEVTYDPEVT